MHHSAVGACSISIHALRVEGDPYTANAGLYISISIHTLRVEGDSKSIQSEKALAFYH